MRRKSRSSKYYKNSRYSRTSTGYAKQYCILFLCLSYIGGQYLNFLHEGRKRKTCISTIEELEESQRISNWRISRRRKKRKRYYVTTEKDNEYIWGYVWNVWMAGVWLYYAMDGMKRGGEAGS